MPRRTESVYRAIGPRSAAAVWVWAIFFLGTAAGQLKSNVAADDAARRDVEEWASMFDAGTFAQREAAMLRMWADYGRSREVVQELARHTDPEVSKRAQWILKRWEIGLLPGLPEAVKRRLASAEGRPAAALVALLDDGYFREAVEVARHQAINGTDEVRGEIAAVIQARYVPLVHAARRSDQLEAMLDLLDLCGETNPLVAARAVLLDRLGRDLDETTILPQCADRWPPRRREEAAAIGLAVLGQFDAAATVARRAQRADLLARILMLDGRWRELAELSRDSIDTELPIEASIEQHAMWLVAARLAGMDESLAEATEKMRGATAKLDLPWRSLAVAGQFAHAIEAAKETDPAAAADLLAARQETAAAFETLGVNPAAPRPDLQRMIRGVADQWTQSAAGGQPNANADQLEPLLTATRLLYSIGDHTVAASTLKQIAGLSHSQGTKTLPRREAAMLALRLGMQRLVPELLAGESDPFDGEIGMYLSLELASQSPGFFQAIGGAMQAVRPDDTPAKRLADAIDLLSARLPDGWDRQTDLDSLYRALTNFPTSPADGPLGVLRARANLNNGRLNLTMAIRPTYLIGDFFAGLGRGDLAARAYESAAEGDDATSTLRYADVLLAAGDASAALRWYEKAYETLRTSDTPARFGWLRPYNSPEPSAASALAGQAAALTRLGHNEAASEIYATLDLIPFFPLGDLGRDYVDRLETVNQPERQRVAAEYHLRYAIFDRENDRKLYGQAVGQALRLEKTDPAAAAHWTRMAVVGSISQTVLYPSGYVTIPARWHVFDAIAAARQGDADATLASLRQSLEYFPLSISMAEDDLSKIREAGLNREADIILDQILETGTEHVRQFPLDANTINNLAWVAAINGRHYQRALELANRAVFLVPDSTSYRDTLAEVLLRLGRDQQALAVERQCLLDEPDLWHLHEQIERIIASEAQPARS